MVVLGIVGMRVEDGVSLDMVLRVVFSLLQVCFGVLSCRADGVVVRLGPPDPVSTNEGWPVRASLGSM